MKCKRLILLLVVVAVFAILGGCYPDKIDYVNEYDIAATLYDKEADFASYTTFTVIDTVMHITDDEEDDPNFSRDHDAKILQMIREELEARNYTNVASPDSANKPDLVILVEAVSNEYLQYWPGYWGGYWGWYPGWNWWYGGGYYWKGTDYYYPWYPIYPWYPGYVSSYTTGTLIIDMFDTDTYDPEANTLNSVWTGLVNGLMVEYNDPDYMWTRIEKQIEQLFKQSDYLGK